MADSTAADDAEARSKLTCWVDAADVQRARAAYAETKDQPDGAKSFSEFVARAIRAESERLERKHNGGDQWPPRAPGSIAKGKPVGLGPTR